MPLCTCLTCRGKQTHAGDRFPGAQSEAKSSSEVDFLVLQGKACVFCETRKSPSQASFLLSHREFMICKKSHLYGEAKVTIRDSIKLLNLLTRSYEKFEPKVIVLLSLFSMRGSEKVLLVAIVLLPCVWGQWWVAPPGWAVRMLSFDFSYPPGTDWKQLHSGCTLHWSR